MNITREEDEFTHMYPQYFEVDGLLDHDDATALYDAEDDVVMEFHLIVFSHPSIGASAHHQPQDSALSPT